MGAIYRTSLFIASVLTGVLLVRCGSNTGNTGYESDFPGEPCTFEVQAEGFTGSMYERITMFPADDSNYIKTTGEGWLDYEINVPVAGRYKTRVYAQTPDTSSIYCWIEDYVGNEDQRTYNITGNIPIERVTKTGSFAFSEKDGSPLNSGIHHIRLHFKGGTVVTDRICFTLIKPHKYSPVVLTQKTDGKQWKLVWSDEFDGGGLPDTTKWTFDIGNWGWGNNELQYYTENKTENARQENGTLVIEAVKNNAGHPWTSARLTTRGKESFLYGRIEFRAKAPAGRGTWSAGWLLGDAYIDELSWPYCGEVDILENVGYEIDEKTGNGKTHATIHCGAYYFKKGNQPTSIEEVENMNNEFHIYTLEWMRDGLSIHIDGKKYFEYKDISNDLTWPFNKPQNIIMNLAIGGGWGGARGIDPSFTSQKYIIDYVRVYELQ